MKQLSIFRRFNNVSISKKLYFVAGVMALLIAIELFALWFSVNSLSSIRAYVGAEGLWSKAQKDAIYHLRQYGSGREEKDYQEFHQFMKVPLGDKKGRIELEKENPDFDIARQGFLEGGVHPDDIDGMINLFRRFRKISYLDKAIGIWTEADPIIGKLLPIGERLHREITSSSPSQAKIDKILLEIDPINRKLTQLENDFSHTLGEGSRWLESLVLKILFIIALTVEISGLALTISVSRRISKGIKEVMRVSKEVAKGNFSEKAEVYSLDEIGSLSTTFNTMIDDLRDNEKTIRESEERYRTLFDNTTDLIQSVSPNGMMQFTNKAWREKLGYTEEEVKNLSLMDLLSPVHQQQCMGVLQAVVQGRDSQNIETEFLAKDGSKITVAGNINCKFVAGIPESIQCFLRDVSEEKLLAEKELMRIEELEKIRAITIGRELKMVELKKEIEELKAGKRIKNENYLL